LRENLAIVATAREAPGACRLWWLYLVLLSLAGWAAIVVSGAALARLIP
jgi:hypothetical protein